MRSHHSVPSRLVAGRGSKRASPRANEFHEVSDAARCCEEFCQRLRYGSSDRRRKRMVMRGMTDRGPTAMVTLVVTGPLNRGGVLHRNAALVVLPVEIAGEAFMIGGLDRATGMWGSARTHPRPQRFSLAGRVLCPARGTPSSDIIFWTIAYLSAIRQEAPQMGWRGVEAVIEILRRRNSDSSFGGWGSTSARRYLVSQKRSILTDYGRGFILQSEGRGLVHETVSTVSLGNRPVWCSNASCGPEFAGSEPGWRQPESGWEPDAKGSGTECHRGFGSVSYSDRQRLGDTASQEKLTSR